MQAAMDQLVAFGTTYGLKIIGAVLILIIGRIAAGLGRKFVIRLLDKYKTDPAVVSFAGSLIFILGVLTVFMFNAFEELFVFPLVSLPLMLLGLVFITTSCMGKKTELKSEKKGK